MKRIEYSSTRAERALLGCESARYFSYPIGLGRSCSCRGGAGVATECYIIFVCAVIEEHKKRITGLTRISVDPHHRPTRNKK